jgi:hypothetical protein
LLRSVLIAGVLLPLAACGSRTPKEPVAPATPDYKAMTSVTQVEQVIPEDLKLPYQQLFGCTFDLAAKRKQPAPVIDPVLAGRILEAVRKDPSAGRKCLKELRSS